MLAHHTPEEIESGEGDADRVLELVRERFGLGVRIAIGEPSIGIEQLRAACQDVTDALWIGDRARPDARLLRVRDLRAHQALAGIPHRSRDRFVESMLGRMMGAADWVDLRGTIIAWCENGFKLVAAAEALHSHRSTLVYRLDKVERLVGRPWRDHRAMLSLYMASLANQLDRPA